MGKTSKKKNRAKKGPTATIQRKKMRSHDTGTIRGKKNFKLHTLAQQTLGKGNIAAAVELPPGEDESEWLAVHVVDFFNELMILYGLVADEDTPERFPTMSAGKAYEYRWQDKPGEKARSLPACEYVDKLFTWIEDQLNDESNFPTTMESAFPTDFRSRVVSTIFRRLFRVYAHVYYNHFPLIIEKEAQAHLNSCFKHFILFSRHFKLVPEREFRPMKDAIETLCDDKRVDRANSGRWMVMEHYSTENALHGLDERRVASMDLERGSRSQAAHDSSGINLHGLSPTAAPASSPRADSGEYTYAGGKKNGGGGCCCVVS